MECTAPEFHAHPIGANSFPKVTDLICRLPLPTFVYRLEAMNLENLMRNWYGYAIRNGIHHVFTGHVQEPRYI